ncbi:hypothetical protein [Abiotrophia defectiva]|uniref:hypothetical protein n=1 Tax=Abiotrophia defectiva TaxID=46125 RepID=UPI0028E6C533|nr:hypothetical protein [uncultured Abiotrophia sp.]
MKIEGIYQSPIGSVVVLSETPLMATPGDFLKIGDFVYKIRNFGFGDRQSVLLDKKIDESLSGLEVEILTSNKLTTSTF